MIANNSKHTCKNISTLPDELLVTILEKLNVPDAVKTGFLSNRWRNLWKYISIIEFDQAWVSLTGKQIPSSVNEFVKLHKGQKVKKFSVHFNFQPEMSADVDSWVLFAVNKAIEELDLNFAASVEGANRSYRIPPQVFNCKSLTSLTLSFCVLELPLSFQLQNLRKVHFGWIDVPQGTIQMLTSNTPILEELLLVECNKSMDLQIHVTPNPNFSLLVIIEHTDNYQPGTTMDLKVPTCHRLILNGFLLRSRYIIGQTSECPQAEFDFQRMFDISGSNGVLVNGLVALEYEEKLLELLGGFKDVDFIEICNWSVQILSMREQRSLGRLAFKCSGLHIITSFQKWELPGIIYMLKACPRLEGLMIIITTIDEEITVPRDYLEQHNFDAESYFETQDLRDHLNNLEYVEFRAYEGNYQTWTEFDFHKFFYRAELGMDLLNILYKGAPNLQMIACCTDLQEEVIYSRGGGEEEDQATEAAAAEERKGKRLSLE